MFLSGLLQHNQDFLPNQTDYKKMPYCVWESPVFPSPILLHFCKSMIENILKSSTPQSASNLPPPKDKLQHSVCADEWVNGCQLPSTKKLHDTRVTKKGQEGLPPSPHSQATICSKNPSCGRQCLLLTAPYGTVCKPTTVTVNMLLTVNQSLFAQSHSDCEKPPQHVHTVRCSQLMHFIDFLIILQFYGLVEYHLWLQHGYIV